MATQFKLPELGENVESAEVVNVLVSAGDHVDAEQALIEVETDKATLEVPSPTTGNVRELHVKTGDTVKVGQPIATIDEEAAAEAAPPEAAAPEEKRATEKEKEEEGEPVEEAAVPQEQGPPGEERAPPREPAKKPEEKPEVTEPQPRAQPTPPAREREPTPAGEPAQRVPVFAAPSVRRFAREIGIEVQQVPGSGPGGRISIEDVKRFARQHRPAAGLMATPPLPRFDHFGDIQRQDMTHIRHKTAEHMVASWTTVPHVVLYEKADLTEVESFRQTQRERVEQAGGKLTITAMLLKIVAAGLKVHPKLRASVDMNHRQVIYKDYCHIGVAVDTDRGLLVPVIRDVDRKSITDLAIELGAISDKARAGKLTPDDMAGGVFTLTNLGGLGIGHFMPIINFPQVAILGLGRATVQPDYNADADEFQPRLMMPLSLSIDHRLVDGADGARFLDWLVKAIEQPLLMVMDSPG
jgi:pyruvate dehydrogenase E2 component (dihydrolipoamide acetyltransferase)